METHDDAGVDLTLIDWMLAKSPVERLLENDRWVMMIGRLRAAWDENEHEPTEPDVDDRGAR
jgi:hypothetical protein